MDPSVELRNVEAKLADIEQQLQALLEQQHHLTEKKNMLKNLIKDSREAKISSVNWNKTDFPWSANLEDTLKSVFKIQQLRPHQLPTMNAALSGIDCILIMPTGGGKSLCYQLPALLSKGITLVVSPLVSLMEDQLFALHALSIEAKMLSASTSKAEANYIHQGMTDLKCPLKLLYVTPEKLAKSKRFMAKLEKMYSLGRFSLLAIDEVHCCSQWGHDFRPDYKFLGIMKRQFPKVPILGLTATATTQVTYDVQKILNIQGCLIFKASFNRPNLRYEVIEKPSSQKGCVETVENLLKTRFKGMSGIIYCLSIKDSEDLANSLQKCNIKCDSYHANMDAKSRSHVHLSWAKNKIQVVVATVAFGMGIDKPDVRFVIHHSISKSMENFYQESGRAGRDDHPSTCILMYRFADMFRLSTMVFTEQTGQENLYAMIAYCIDVCRCRRYLIAQHFGEKWDSTDCNNMCDHCDSTKSGPGLIDIWNGKGKSKFSLPNFKSPPFRREVCERIIAHLILEGYLKEDYHFTPYTTISYIVKGIKSSAVDRNDHKVTISVAKKRTVNQTSPGKCNSVPTSALSSSTSVTSPKKSSILSSSQVKPCIINEGKSKFITNPLIKAACLSSSMKTNSVETSSKSEKKTLELHKKKKTIKRKEDNNIPNFDLDFDDDEVIVVKKKTKIICIDDDDDD